MVTIKITQYGKGKLKNRRRVKHITHMTSCKMASRYAYQLGWKRCLREDVSNPYPAGRRHDAYEKGIKLGRTRKEQESRSEAEEPSSSPL